MPAPDESSAPAATPPRVLFFTPYVTEGPISGGARRSALFQACLARHADLFTVYHTREAVPPGPARAVVRLRTGRDRFYDRRLLAALRAAVRTHRPDLIWAEMFYSIPMLARVARAAGVPLVFNTQNVEVERFAPWPLPHRLFIRWYEAACLTRADWIVCVSARDRARFAEIYGVPLETMRVLPNGFDDRHYQPATATPDARAALFAPWGIDPAAPVILFFGNHHYRPNAEALAWIETALAPALAAEVPAARVLVLGPGSEGRTAAHPAIAYGGTVPDLRPYLHAADLLVCPLAHGGGSRLKIIESLACGLPVLSTPKGAEGLEELGEGDGLYRVARASLIAQVVAGLRDPSVAWPRLEAHSPLLRNLALSTLCTETRALLEAVLTGRGR